MGIDFNDFLVTYIVTYRLRKYNRDPNVILYWLSDKDESVKVQVKSKHKASIGIRLAISDDVFEAPLTNEGTFLTNSKYQP